MDIVSIGWIWVAVYYLRFYSGVFSAPKGISDFKHHLGLTVPVVFFCYLSCLWTGLYRPKRIQNMFRQFIDLLKACLLSALFVLAFFYYVKDRPYSRKLLVLFVPMLFIGLSLSHLSARAILRYLRKRGYNLRHYVVIGAGKKGQMLVRDIQRMGWLGLECAFFVDNNPGRIGSELLGIPIYGPVEKIPELIRADEIDEVYLALVGDEGQRVYPILKSLQSAGITIRIIPDWGNLISISGPAVVPIGTQLLFSAADSSLSGYQVILKRVFDFVVALSVLIIISVPMLVIALLVKLSSKGPVLYEQTRIGMDQKEFKMLKFRTMVVDAEKTNGPQWSKPDDPRRTLIGAWLRKTSLDELPQLINVLKGEMSLVGPRPERPYFVKKFSEQYKKYMFRHKLKAGMTGWAQIYGFRGNTSLRKRLQYDLYYVRNWSVGLDMRVLLRTPWHIIKGKNAH
jgi:exopolysaccharide biosynthesis polyprenyl glycosylphosphotransferase